MLPFGLPARTADEEQADMDPRRPFPFGQLVAGAGDIKRENGTMSDLVNDYFKRFYPANLGDDAFDDKYWSMLGVMRRHKNAVNIFPRMVCADGFSMSVQGHYGAYSTPRDDFAGHYTRVEVGFPSSQEELLMPFMDGDGDPTNSVYGYVPIDVIEQIVAKHGGLVGSEEPSHV